MKKLLYIAIACSLAVCCSRLGAREDGLGGEGGVIALSALDIDISVEDSGQSKSIKTAWAAGDKINIWFDDHYAVSSPDLIISYDGSRWTKSFEREDCMLSASGTFAALFESGNNLGAFALTTTETGATYNVPAADIAGFRFGCAPMVTSAADVSYSVSPSTSVLKAEITGWQYATRFKVFIPTDPNMNKAADKYALSVSKICHPLKSFGTRKISGADRGEPAVTADVMSRYAGGVQEADGIAFYFDSMSCSDEAITFALLESGVSISKTYTTTDKKTLNATSATMCACVQIPYGAFSANGFISGDAETPVDYKLDLDKLQIVYQLSDLEDSVTLDLSNRLAARIGAAKGETPLVGESRTSSVHDREIIIGRTNRPQSQAYYSQKHDDFEWKINYSEGNVIITAGGSWALEYAVNRFADEYLAPDYSYTEGKVEQGTVRGQQLFPLTQGCNLRILDQNVWAREEDTNTEFWEQNGESCALSVRSRRLAQVVRSCMPDIIAFQEYGNGVHNAMKDSLRSYGYTTSLRNSLYYTPIFFNSQTIEYASIKKFVRFSSFTASDGSTKTPDAMKSYMAVLFKHKATGKKFLVVNTHIYTPLNNKYDHECKASEIQIIMDYITNTLKTYDVPVFLVGDMNCQRSSQAMQLLENSGYRHVVDIATLSADGSNGWHICSDNSFMREYDPSMVNHYMGWTHERNQGATRCVDQMYLYNGKSTEVKVFERMHAWFTVLLSDHYPNYADIVL